MHVTTTLWDPYRCRNYNFSTWRPGNAEIVPRYVDKSRAWRPMQQRPRDGIVARSTERGRVVTR